MKSAKECVRPANGIVLLAVMVMFLFCVVSGNTAFAATKTYNDVFASPKGSGYSFSQAKASASSSFTVGDKAYVWAYLHDGKGNFYKKYGSGKCTLTLSLIRPNGSCAHTYTYSDSDNNWIGGTLDTAGTWKIQSKVTGALSGTTTQTITVKAKSSGSSKPATKPSSASKPSSKAKATQPSSKAKATQPSKTVSSKDRTRANKLNAIAKQWKNRYWTKNDKPTDKKGTNSRWYHGIQCKGFASWVYAQITGVNYIGKTKGNNWQLYYTSKKTQLIASVKSASASSSKSAFARAKTGDFIQMKRNNDKRGPHSAIVVEAGANKVCVLECNADAHCKVELNSYSYKTWAKKNLAFSIYRAK